MFSNTHIMIPPPMSSIISQFLNVLSAHAVIVAGTTNKTSIIQRYVFMATPPRALLTVLRCALIAHTPSHVSYLLFTGSCNVNLLHIAFYALRITLLNIHLRNNDDPHNTPLSIVVYITLNTHLRHIVAPSDGY
jgi:hypothetical protein